MKKEISVEKLKAIQIEVLDVVAEYCRSHNLRYFLAYGTLLGAVRHKGYIPWDDDIDIAMPRPDYEYLVRHFNETNNIYRLTHHSLDGNYPIAYAKVFDNRTILVEKVSAKYKLGVNIDIFPIDGVQDNMELTYKNLRKILKIRAIVDRKLAIFPRSQKCLKRYILLFRQKIYNVFFSYYYLNNKINSLASKNKYDSAKYVAVSVYPSNDREVFDKLIFDNQINLEFEGKKYSAPKDYDKYLKTVYGDYMQLPPIEERVTHHSFNAYSID